MFFWVSVSLCLITACAGFTRTAMLGGTRKWVLGCAVYQHDGTHPAAEVQWLTLTRAPLFSSLSTLVVPNKSTFQSLYRGGTCIPWQRMPPSNRSSQWAGFATELCLLLSMQLPVVGKHLLLQSFIVTCFLLCVLPASLVPALNISNIFSHRAFSRSQSCIAWVWRKRTTA